MMKKRLLLLSLCAAALFGQEPPSSFSYWDVHPLHVGGNLLRIGGADLKAPQNGQLYFRKSNAFVYMLVPVSYTSYFFPRIEWNTFTLDWNQNPKFNKTHYYYMQFALTFYTTAIEKWRWIARADYNLDLEHFNNPRQYGLFSALLWGSHEIHRKWHYHVGAVGYTGMEGGQYYPIIGVDFAPNAKWLFQLIFPINYEVAYNFNKEWRGSLKVRPLKERFRTGAREPQPRSVFSYSSTGAELNVHYEKFLRFEAEAYFGYNFGGSFYIKDQHNQNPLYTDVGGALYGGANFNYGF